MRPDPGELHAFERIVETTLEEDLARGDVTSRATVPEGARATAQIVAKQALVVAATAVVEMAIQALDPDAEVKVEVEDGTAIEAGTVVARIEGEARALLAGERAALNLLQRACGVATHTRAHVDAAGDEVRVVDTRKTMPGLRALDRYAVRCGGGANHRDDLGSGVLIKENHVAVAGGVDAAVKAAKQSAPHGMKIECEVRSLDELRAAIDAGADACLLDNMSLDELRQAVALAGGRVLLEASGGVNLETIGPIAATGVDVISVGGLTHSAPAVDLSMLFRGT